MISSSDILPISFLISDGPASVKVSSDNVVVTAIHLQAVQNEEAIKSTKTES